MNRENLKLVTEEDPEGPEEEGKCPVCGMPLDDCACIEVEYIDPWEYIAHLEMENESLASKMLVIRAERDALRQILDSLLSGDIETQ
jgi:hypothetical protein